MNCKKGHKLMHLYWREYPKGFVSTGKRYCKACQKVYDVSAREVE